MSVMGKNVFDETNFSKKIFSERKLLSAKIYLLKKIYAEKLVEKRHLIFKVSKVK